MSSASVGVALHAQGPVDVDQRAGEPDGERPPGSGNGGGYGLGVIPVGALVIRDGTVSWRPAVDVNKVILGGQLVAVVALLTLRSYLKLRARRN